MTGKRTTQSQRATPTRDQRPVRVVELGTRLADWIDEARAIAADLACLDDGWAHEAHAQCRRAANGASLALESLWRETGCEAAADTSPSRRP